MPIQSDHTTKVHARPRLRRTARAFLGVLASWVLLGLAVHLGRTNLVEWAGKRAGLDWRIDQVEWSASERSVELHGVQIQDEAWMATSDTLACVGISWVQGVLNVDRIHLGTLEVIQSGTPQDELIASEETAALDWETLWTGMLKGVDLRHLDWNEIRIEGASNPDLTLGQGLCNGLTCNTTGVELNALEWSFISGNLPSLEFPLEMDSSSLHGSWSPSGWDVETSTLSLPGLDFEGTLAWPSMTGRGQAKVQWESLPQWVLDMEPQGWMDTLRLRGETTSLAWDLDDSLWTADAKGPDWLSIWANGNTNAWQGQAHIGHIPKSIKDVLPSDSLNLLASGTGNALEITLSGGPELDVRISATAAADWATWLSAPGPPQQVHAFIDNWGTWISDPSQRVEAKIDSEGDSLLLGLAQPHLKRPWSMSGVLEGHALDIAATLNGLDATSPPAGAATLHMELDSADQSVAWRGTCVLADMTDRLNGRGEVHWRGSEPEWNVDLSGQGARLEVDGVGMPDLPDLNAVFARSHEPVTWGDMHLHGQLAPKSAWASWLLPSANLQDTLSMVVNMDSTDLRGHLTMPELVVADVAVECTELTVIASGNSMEVDLESRVLLDSSKAMAVDVEARLVGQEIWEASLVLQDRDFAPFVWRMEAAPTSNDLWACSILEGTVPIPGSMLKVQDTPVQWIASSELPLPPNLTFSDSSQVLEIATELGEDGSTTVNVEGAFEDLDNWTQPLDSALDLSRLELEGSLVLNANQAPSALLALHGFNASYESIELDNIDVRMSLHQGFLNVFLDSKRASTNTTLNSHLTWQPFLPDAQPQLTVNLANLPFEWTQPWLDSSLVQLTGRLDADLQIDGVLNQPRIQGHGNVDSLKADVPSLGTHFGGHGTFQIGEDDLWLNNFSLYDALGNGARMEGALIHDNFEDWNFDASIVETPAPLLLMDLSEQNNDVAFGQLVVGGSLDLFYWNGNLDIRGDLAAFEGTDLHLALLTEETAGWDNTVEFLQPPTVLVEEEDQPDEDEVAMLIDLNLETQREAKITILTDPDNNANIVGYTQGNLHVLMDDWEHMTLNGELDVVEGRYDLALGSLVRKTFVAQPGGRLFWNGDPYEGTLDLEAVYTTRANVQPLLGNGATQVQNEDVEVLLQLTGPMMTPNLTFDLATPQAPPLVSEALASAVADPSEKTSQAIALLSLQEFLPPQYNSLELGSNGLQDYTVDVVTSQLSQWLSRFNEDIDIGIRYDAQRTSAEAPATSQQDALQVALRASFLNDRLEVEGAVGSREITQEALGETHLQNIRVLYHLNEDKSLQLTGFSEAQASATQTANTTSQGVGIRWHKSFNWTWPWSKKEDQD